MKAKDELLRELDQTQQMINAAETAMRFGLTLDETSFTRYTDAVERQKQIAEDLSGYEETAKGLVVSTAMHGKQSELITDTCVIEAVEELSRADFDDFRERMLRDYDFILDHSRSLMAGTDGRYHCLLVLCEGESDGILVDSEGSAYARYSGFLPDARIILEDRCQRVARDLLSEGKDSFSDTELRSRYGMDLFDGGCLRQVFEKAAVKIPEVESLVCRDGVYTFGLKEDHDSYMTVAELIRCGLEDVHLLHTDEEIDVATIVRLSSDMITEAGFDEWYDVMSAKVERIYTGNYGLQVDVSGCDAERLADISYALAGYCSEEDYDRWFRDESNAYAMGMEGT